MRSLKVGWGVLVVEAEVALGAVGGLRDELVATREEIAQLRHDLARTRALPAATEALERVNDEHRRLGGTTLNGHLEEQLGRSGAGAIRAVDDHPASRECCRVQHGGEDCLELHEDQVVDGACGLVAAGEGGYDEEKESRIGLQM